jgi:hypothetical protein
MSGTLMRICVLSMGSLAWAQSAPTLGSARSFGAPGATTGVNTAAIQAKKLDRKAIAAAAASAVGRWEIVHTSGDSSAQTAAYPGGFSTFLEADGTGNTFGTSTSSICVIDAEQFNIVPTWIGLGGNVFQITITVDNLGLGPDFSFVYTGTYDPNTPVPGNTALFIPAITGTYFPIGDASACSVATEGSPGNFVATFLPTISSGSATGSLDGFTADNGSPFDATVSATITFSPPSAPGQMAGTVSLGSNPTLNSNGCFATTNGVVNPLIVNPARSTQSGVSEYIFADGLDPQGVPTTLFLNGFSSNLYTTTTNTDPNAIQITTSEWAVLAAIGEDNPAVGIDGVSNDGTNNVIVVLYGVLGGACNNAGGVDAPFHFLAGTPIVHKHRERRHRRHRGDSESRGW